MYIKQAAELSGATQRAIRLYESLGLLKVARSGKYRVYSEKNIYLIKLIKEAQSLGIHLAELVTLKNQDEDFDWQVVRDFLNVKQQAFASQIEQLQSQMDKIEQYKLSIDKCLQGLDSDP